MCSADVSIRSRRRLAQAAAALAALLLLAAPAHAQSGGDPFGFLKPWLEKQIFGKERSAESPPENPTTGALPEDGAQTEASPEATPEAPPGDLVEDPTPPDADNAEAPPLAEAPAPEAQPDEAVESEPTPAIDDDMPAVTEAKPEPLRFAVLAGRSVARTMAAIGPIADDLSNLLERPVEFLPFPSYAAMIDALVERRIDGGFYSGPAFAVAEARCGCMEPVVAPRASDGTLAYHAIVVTRADSAIRSVADLAGRRVAVGSKDSVGLRRMQLAGLMAEGFDPARFGAVMETGSAEEAVRLVVAGRADAAFAWSSLAGPREEGYSRGTLTDLVAGDAIAMDAIAILWRSPPIEHGPFALLRTLAESEKTAIETYFVGLTSGNPDVYDELNPFYGGGYAPVDPRDYAGLEMLTTQDVDALDLPMAKTEMTPADTTGQAVQ